MKKLICTLLTLVLILSMAAPVAAVTPPLDTPSISIPDISDDVHVELPDSYWDSYFAEHPITLTPTEAPTEAPTEPTEEPTEPPTEECTGPAWHDWLRSWYDWWSNLIC